MMLHKWLRAGRAALSTAAAPPASSAAAAVGLERFQNVPGFKEYPHAFPVSMSLQKYQQMYAALEPKARETQDAVALAGRIVSIRAASKKLVFLDLQSNGTTVQVLSELKHFVGSDANAQDAEAAKIEFERVHESLRRGDIIGTSCTAIHSLL